MSRFARLVFAPWRLAQAMRREGVGPVLDFLTLTLRRRGLRGALRLGLVDSDHRQADAEVQAKAESEAPPPPDIPSRPPDLDARYTLSVQDWARWAPVLGAPPHSADPRDDLIVPAVVRFVIQGAEADPMPATSTRQAITRLRAADAAEWIAPPDGGGLPAEAFVVFLRAGDIPSPLLPVEIARAARGGRAEVVSFDMVRATRGDMGERMQPLLFPGANPTLLREADYLFSRVALRGAALPRHGDLATADPRALILAWLDTVDVNAARGRWRHVGRPLVQAAIDDAEVERLRETALARGRRPLNAYGSGDVTVVICTKDKGHLTRQLVRTLLASSAETVAEVVIVSNDTTNPYALQTLKDLAQEPRVQVIRQNGPFNFSRMSNTGARAGTKGRHLLFLNDGITPVSEDWLERMVARLDWPEVGAVGPLLLYPDERVQHAGMYTGFNGRAGDTLRGARLPDGDYLLTCVAAREVSCLTGAVLLTPRIAFEAMNGFDEQLATYLQNVDYGLRLRHSGWVNVFEPASVLIHMESASIDAIERAPAFHRRREAEHARFVQRWSPAVLARDPLHARGFALEDEALMTLTSRRHSSFGAGARKRTEQDGLAKDTRHLRAWRMT